MKAFIAIIGIAVTAGIIAWSTLAHAACPPGTKYTCYQGFNGKVICSCQ